MVIHSLILGLAGASLLALGAAGAHAQSADIRAHSENQALIAAGHGGSVRGYTGVNDIRRSGRVQIRAYARNTAAIALAPYSRAELNVGYAARSVRARRVSLNGALTNSAALSIAPGRASVSVASACSGGAHSIRSSAHASGVVALNAGFWTPLPRRVNIGSVNC